METFSHCIDDHSRMADALARHGRALTTIQPTPVYITTMTLEFVVSVRPDLRAISMALRRTYNWDAAGTLPKGKWRGHGFSMPKKHKHVCLRGGTFGDVCLSLTVGDEGAASTSAPWEIPSCHAKVFNTGHVKLMGCNNYAMASSVAGKLLGIIAETSSSSSSSSSGRVAPVRVERTSTHLINGVFSMPPFARNMRIMDKELLNDLAREAGFHVHSGAGDGKPYIKLVLERGIKALVYVSGKVWVTGCRSVQDLGSAAQRVQSFIDEHAQQLLSDDD